MMLQSGVINGPKNPQFVFRSTLTGEIRSEDAELTVNYVDGEGQTGVLFGINARPLTEGHGKGKGHRLPGADTAGAILIRRTGYRIP